MNPLEACVDCFAKDVEIDRLKATLDEVHLKATFELSEPPGYEVSTLQDICDLIEGVRENKCPQ